MRFYTQVNSQLDMDNLLSSMAGFHDSMTKEIHVVNRGFVQPGGTMAMTHRFDAQLLIQSQGKPFAIELACFGIQEFYVGEAGEYFGATGTVETIETPVQKRRISLAFDAALRVVSAGLAYRVRSDWLGSKSFLTSEVPADDAIPAKTLDGNWRQCSSCRDAWQEEAGEEFSYCPGCGRITQIA